MFCLFKGGCGKFIFVVVLMSEIVCFGEVVIIIDMDLNVFFVWFLEIGNLFFNVIVIEDKDIIGKDFVKIVKFF